MNALDRANLTSTFRLRLMALSILFGATAVCLCLPALAHDRSFEAEFSVPAASLPHRNVVSTALTDVEFTGTGDSPSTDNGNNLQPDTGERGDAQVPETDIIRDADRGTEKQAAPSGVPSLLEDPAGAISRMLTPPARRGDLPHDLSPWAMFMGADWVVKTVMIGLAFASLVTWTVWLVKSLELAGARARANRTLAAIRTSKTLDEAVQRVNGSGGPAALMLRAAKEEAELSDAAIDHAGGGGLKERVSAVLGRVEAYAGRRMSKGTGVLATIGSTAPFVGLFGTVWGIMNSFIGISEAQTTNLAVVAPGIAEALLATAIGLVAAIPAVVIYNVFARSITGYRQLLADAAVGIERLVSRDLDFRKVPASSAFVASALAAE